MERLANSLKSWFHSKPEAIEQFHSHEIKYMLKNSGTRKVLSEQEKMKRALRKVVTGL